jgi:hypothetical protein
MRMYRILTGLIAFALIGLVPFVSSSAATATVRDAQVGRTAVSTQAPAARAAKPHRKISDKIVARGTHKLIFKAHVKGDPTYSKKVVKIQRKIGKHGHWKRFKTVKSNNAGRVKTQVPAGGRNCDSSTGRGSGCWYFRAFTPKSKHYAGSYSPGNYFTYRY